MTSTLSNNWITLGIVVAVAVILIRIWDKYDEKKEKEK